MKQKEFIVYYTETAVERIQGRSIVEIEKKIKKEHPRAIGIIITELEEKLL